jgi:hypothetical protein
LNDHGNEKQLRVTMTCDHPLQCLASSAHPGYGQHR